MLSSEKDLEDFLRRMVKAPVRVMLEYTPADRSVLVSRAYDSETDRLLGVCRDGG